MWFHRSFYELQGGWTLCRHLRFTYSTGGPTIGIPYGITLDHRRWISGGLAEPRDASEGGQHRSLARGREAREKHCGGSHTHHNVLGLSRASLPSDGLCFSRFVKTRKNHPTAARGLAHFSAQRRNNAERTYHQSYSLWNTPTPYPRCRFLAACYHWVFKPSHSSMVRCSGSGRFTTSLSVFRVQTRYALMFRW